MTEEKQVRKVWKDASHQLEALLHPDVYSRWIAVIDAIELTEETLTLAVDNGFYQTWLEDNYVPLIKDAVTAVVGKHLDIRFCVRSSAQKIEEPKPIQKKTTIRERLNRHLQRPQLNPKFTFDQFIIGPSNQFAHAAALAVAQAPAKAYNPLFIYGGTGLGKTHVMQSIGQHVLSTSRASVAYLSSEEFVNEYIDALQNRRLVQFRKKYRNIDLLLIDDIHFLAGKERLQEEFFHTFNALFDAHKQIVMTSDRPANEIANLEKRLVSRFEWGLVTELESPDLETRIAILRHKQEEQSVQLPDPYVQFIAQNIRSNIRRLEGALIRSLSYASLTGKDLTLETLKHLLRDMLDEEDAEEVSFSQIQRTVAEHFDISLADMVGNRRPRSIAVPRQIAMFLCRKMTRSSLPDIAVAFNKTHATVLHACKTVHNRMDVDAQIRDDVERLSQKLGCRVK